MANLTGDRDTPKRTTRMPYAYAMKGNTKIFSGGGVIIVAGYAQKAGDVAGGVTAGRANSTVDTTASGPKGVLADGAEKIECEHGAFKFATSGANAIVAADVGGFACWLDDQTVVAAAGTANEVVAGRILELDPDGGVWIDTADRSVDATPAA